MKIGILSRRSGVPIPTIKFYLREELLEPGDLTRINQASYSEEHLRRLRLIQSLSHVGGLSLKQIRGILAVIDKPEYPVHDVLVESMRPHTCVFTSEEYRAALASVDGLIGRYQWRIAPDSPARAAAATIVATMRTLGVPADPPTGLLDRMAYHADAIAFGEDPAATTEQAFVTAAIGDRLLTALRRLAEENVYEVSRP